MPRASDRRWAKTRAARERTSPTAAPRTTGEKTALPPVSSVDPELLRSTNAGQPDERCRQDCSGPSRDLPHSDRDRGGHAERCGDRQINDLADTRKRRRHLGQGTRFLLHACWIDHTLGRCVENAKASPRFSSGRPMPWLGLRLNRVRDERLPDRRGLAALPGFHRFSTVYVAVNENTANPCS